MVCVCVAGGCLSDKELLDAARIYQSGDVKSALALYRAIIEKSPHQPQALMMIGVIAQQLGNPKVALTFLDAALEVDPHFFEAWFNRSIVLRALNRDIEALVAARKALDINPSLAAAFDIQAQILKDQGSFDEAETAYAQALTLDPSNANFYTNFASLLLAKGDLVGAYKASKIGLTLDPSMPQMVLGNIYKAMGYPQKAADCFAHTQQLYPSLFEATTSEAMATLQMGEMRRGWTLWEKRLDMRPDLKNIPLWQGEMTSHLLLYEDQGIGDALHFMRFLPYVEESVEQLTLQVPQSLKRLCQNSFPSLAIDDEARGRVPYSARCRLSSLAFHFQDRGETLSETIYLKADSSRRLHYREFLTKEPSPHIGFAWAGNPHFHGDALRSLSLSTLEPFLRTAKGHLVSLQKNRPSADDYFRTFSVLDPTPELSDFAETAALIDELDLVVTVDTAIAHLAGALHKPVFILLPFDSDWRWLLGRKDSPWYPSAKLFRQSKPGVWRDVVENVSSEVQKFLSGDRTILEVPAGPTENLRENPNALPLHSF